MFQRNDNRRREPRRTDWTSSLVLSYRGQTEETYFHPADKATMQAFFSNLKGFDEGAFRDIAAQAPTAEFNGGTPVAILNVDNLRSALRAGEELFTGFEPDGNPRDCGICGQEFQPVRIPFNHRDGSPGVGGNFATLKTEKLDELIGKGGDLAARVQTVSDAMTKEVMGNEPVPSRAKLLPVCKDCREMLQVPTFALETAREGLLGADKKIGVVADRFAAAEVLGRPPRHAVGSGPSNGRRFDNRNDRPQKPRVDWHGADLEEATAVALTAAGYSNLADALRAAENGDLLAKGVAHAGSIGPITFALKRAGESRTIVGEGRAVSARDIHEAPGAARPKARGKRRELTAPATRSSGKVGLADLRG